MDFSYTPEQEAFRARLREWLERNATEVFGSNREALSSSATLAGDDDRWRRVLE